MKVKVFLPDGRRCDVDNTIRVGPRNKAVTLTRSQIRGEAKKILGILGKGRLPVGTALVG